MQIKDLPNDTPLKGLKFIHPDTGEICTWIELFDTGILYKNKSGEMEMCQVDTYGEALNLEVANFVEG